VRYPIEVLAHGKQIVSCEIFDKVSKTHIDMKGFVDSRTKQTVTVMVPESQSGRHKFFLHDLGDGFGYEGSSNIARGWRIKLDQLKEP
jgi:hypothetical protein